MAKRRVRLDVESAELRQFNFKPQVNDSFQAMGGRRKSTSKVSAGGDTSSYIKKLKRDEDEKEKTRAKRIQEKLDREMTECTFTPQKTKCPTYIKRIANSMAISKKHRAAFKEPEQPSWK